MRGVEGQNEIWSRAGLFLERYYFKVLIDCTGVEQHLSERIQRKSFIFRLPLKEKKWPPILQFHVQKVVFLDLCGYLKILKILPGLIHAFDSVRCQTLSWLLLRILWTPRPHVRHLRRTPTSMPHWGRPMPGLNHGGYWTESKSFSEELPREGYFRSFQFPACSEERCCTVCSSHEGCMRSSAQGLSLPGTSQSL